MEKSKRYELYKNILTDFKTKSHPEKRDGEVFIGNAGLNGLEFNSIGWKTKRLGIIAYDKNGKISEDKKHRPIFIQLSEMEKDIEEWRANDSWL